VQAEANNNDCSECGSALMFRVMQGATATLQLATFTQRNAVLVAHACQVGQLVLRSEAFANN
jgi:hypothetical protein